MSEVNKRWGQGKGNGRLGQQVWTNAPLDPIIGWLPGRFDFESEAKAP